MNALELLPVWALLACCPSSFRSVRSARRAVPFHEERSRSSASVHCSSIHSCIRTLTTLSFTRPTLQPSIHYVRLLQPFASLICLQRAPPTAAGAAAAPTSAMPLPRSPNPPCSSSNRRPSLRNPLRLLSKRFAAATTQFQRASHPQNPRPPQPPQPHHLQPQNHNPRPTIPPFSAPSQTPHAVHHHVPPPQPQHPPAAATAPLAAAGAANRMPADARHAAPVVPSAAAAYSNYNAHLVIGWLPPPVTCPVFTLGSRGNVCLSVCVLYR